MIQELSFYLSLITVQDEKSGDYTAFFAQFPDASAQGRSAEEAKKLLFEIFPILLNDKKEEFLRYHPDFVTNSRHVDITDQIVKA